MTVLDATNKLVEYFAQNSYFELESCFKRVILISDTDADKAAILLALEELAAQKFVALKEVDGKQWWVLMRPLSAQTLELQLSLMGALEISNALNKYVDQEEDKVSPFRVSERDIMNLCSLATRA